MEVGLRLFADRVDDAVPQVGELMQSAPGDVACHKTYGFSFAPGGDEAGQTEAKERRFQLAGGHCGGFGQLVERQRSGGVGGVMIDEGGEEPA
ncbi:hypothetical protein GCM10027074_67170 [Streptomyces deserti]